MAWANSGTNLLIARLAQHCCHWAASKACCVQQATVRVAFYLAASDGCSPPSPLSTGLPLCALSHPTSCLQVWQPGLLEACTCAMKSLQLVDVQLARA